MGSDASRSRDRPPARPQRPDWEKKGLASSSERFDHDYTEAELASVAESVVEIARAVPLTHVILNNNYEDQGQRNGKTMMALLGQTQRG